MRALFWRDYKILKEVWQQGRPNVRKRSGNMAENYFFLGNFHFFTLKLRNLASAYTQNGLENSQGYTFSGSKKS